MRNGHKILIVALAHACFLLPERIFPDDNSAYPFLYQKVDNVLASCMEVVVHLPVPFVSNLLHLLGDMLSILFGEAQLEFFHALIIPLVPGFERPTVNQSRDKALSV